LRHLRYFVAVADAGTFTRAAERMYIAQPTLSQQIKRLEELVGAPLLRRCRDGVQLTAAGEVLLEESRSVLSVLDHGVRRTRQAAGLGRARLRMVLPPDLPESLAVDVVARLEAAATAADLSLLWLESALDADFSVIRERRADAAIGWLPAPESDMGGAFEVMTVGEYAPEVWITARQAAGRAGAIGLDALAEMDLLFGPRGAAGGLYAAWARLFREHRCDFEFKDPPFRHRLLLNLEFAAAASRPTALLTGPRHDARTSLTVARAASGMVPVMIAQRPLAATAAVVWNTGLPRHLQQVLFDVADGLGEAGATLAVGSSCA